MSRGVVDTVCCGFLGVCRWFGKDMYLHDDADIGCF